MPRIERLSSVACGSDSMGLTLRCNDRMYSEPVYAEDELEIGIETLIVFIALILVAATAASVFLSTSNRLQQRALAVGSSAQDRVSNGILIECINGYTLDHKITAIDIFIRLQPGSDELHLKDVQLLMNVPLGLFEASVATTERSDYRIKDISDLYLSSTAVSVDTDLDQIPDAIDDSIAFIHRNPGTELFRFWVGDETFDIDTGVDWDTAELVNLSAIPIQEEGTYSLTHGYLTIFANMSNFTGTPEALDLLLDGFRCDDEPTVFVACQLQTDIATDDLAKLKPLHRFGIVAKRADSDLILENKEFIALRYKLSEPYFIPEDHALMVTVVAKSSKVSTADIQVPPVMLHENIDLWP